MYMSRVIETQCLQRMQQATSPHLPEKKAFRIVQNVAVQYKTSIMNNDGNIRNTYSALKQSLAVVQRTEKCIARLKTKFEN